MKSGLYKFLSSAITVLLVLVAGVFPLIFSTLTTDFYDMPKLIFLVVVTVVLYALWVLSWVAKGKIEITRTPLDIPILLILATILVSTFLSTSKYSSIYGIFPEVHGSAVSWITYILLYFVTVSNLKKTNHIKTFLYAFYFGGIILSLISIFAFFGVYLPFEVAKSVNFTPTGLSFSTAAILLMLLPLALSSSVSENKFMPQIAAVFVSVIFTITVVLIGSLTVNVVLLVVFLATIFSVRNHFSKGGIGLLIAPVAVSLIALLLLNIPFSGNRLYLIKRNFPEEVQLPAGVSWKISATAFRDAPFVGTGPATFLYNFTNYKPVEFNQERFWNFSFGVANNEFLQVIGTWGLFGVFSLVGFSFVVIAVSKKYLFSGSKIRQILKAEGGDVHVILPSLAVSVVTAILLLFLHATSLVFVVTMFLVLAVYMTLQKQIREKQSVITIGVKVSASGDKQLDLLPLLVLLVFLIAAIPFSKKAYSVIAADYYHRYALSQADKDGTKTYEYLQKAEVLNPHIDLYRVDLAQTNFALANALATQKGPTTENPEGSLTESDQQTIQTLVTQSINEGRAAVALSPRSSRNWEILALIYRNITGVANNALTFSLDAYGRAIQMDPMNPALRINAGSIYYASGNYDLAIRFFSDAINLKPNYVNGYYNLAIAFRDKGDLQNAKLVSEQAVRMIQQDIGSKEYESASDAAKKLKERDLAMATELQNQIKNQIDTNESPKQTQEQKALQNVELPTIEVPGLDELPETEIPPAVEENPAVDLPEINTSNSANETPAP